MTCRRDPFRGPAYALALLFALSGCGSGEPELTPLEQAQLSLDNGDGLGAEIALRKLLEQGVPPEQLAAYIGQAELLQGQFAEARRWLGEGRFSESSRGYGFHMLGRLEMAEGDLAAAGRAFDRAFASIPDSADLWVDVARLRFRGGEQAQAIEASKRAVELGPENPAALQLRAQLVRDADGLRASLPWFEAALEHNPDNIELLGEYAATLGDLGRAQDMLATVRRMAEIDDRYPRILYLQSVLAARAGKFDLARTLLQRVEPMLRQTPAVLVLSGIVDMENGNYESAAQAFDRLVTMQPDNSRARHLLARSVALGLNEAELAHRFTDLAQRSSASPWLRILLARAYEADEEREKAAALLDRAAEPKANGLHALPGHTPLSVAEMRDDDSGSNVLSLVRGRILAGQPAAAVREAEAFRKRFPGSADAMALAGDAYRANGDTERALGHYRGAASIRRTWPLVKRMAGAYRFAGRGREAAMLLERHFAGDPGNAEAAGELARIAMASGHWPRAAMLLDHALDHGGERDPSLWALRAIAARQLGDDELAYDAAVFAYALQPMSRETTALLTQLLAEYGEDEAAVAFADKLRLMAR